MPSGTRTDTSKDRYVFRLSTVIAAAFLCLMLIVSGIVSFAGYWGARDAVRTDINSLGEKSKTIGRLLFNAHLQVSKSVLDLTVINEKVTTGLQSGDHELVADALNEAYYSQQDGDLDVLFAQIGQGTETIDVSASLFETDGLLKQALANNQMRFMNEMFVTVEKGQTLYSILHKKEILHLNSGKVLGYLYAGVILNDATSVLNQINNNVGSSSLALVAGDAVVSQLHNTSIGVDTGASTLIDAKDVLALSLPLDIESADNQFLELKIFYPQETVKNLGQNYLDIVLMMAVITFVLSLLSVWVVRRFSRTAIHNLKEYAAYVSLGKNQKQYAPSRIKEFNEIGGVLHQVVLDLEETEARAESILDNASAVIYYKDVQGRYLFVNKSYEDLFQVKKEQLIGQKGMGHLSADFAEEMTGNDLKVLRQNKAMTFEEQAHHDDGVHTYLSVKFPLKSGSGETVGICGFATDITDRIKAEKALRSAKEQAEYANRSKVEFLANMSHELRTPLNAVIGFSDLLKMQLKETLDDKQLQYIDDINQSGVYLLSLINDILDVSRLELHKVNIDEDYFDLNKTLEDACRMLKARAEEARVDLKIEPFDALPEMIGDQRRVKQIILNLVSNAIKFTPEPGLVRASTLVNDKSEIVLQVSDTGVGIAEDDLARVLDPFAQVENSMTRTREGSGLGLSLVRSLTDLHNGDLRINSKLGKGTEITITFPASRTTGGTGPNGDQSTIH